MLKKVVVIGPESTGKSTLSQDLASYFRAPWVPEFARTYLENLNRPYVYEDLLEIAKGQIQLEDNKAQHAGQLLICDTDLHVIKVWSEHKFGQVHDWVLEQIKTRKYDIYLLADIDIPWQEDPQREHPEPEMRRHFFDIYSRLVRQTGVPFEIISGNEKERIKKAVKAIELNLK
ncbi:AAA family ATPase [Cecembia rubra]|uniref:NadR type nicotinamide-nucleotide adenylyltransferase n=2 Tax=Cecembia rubra TaxID=1485585 RepID=A0A2P8E4H4_9BACT|nr:ATP-binding protein [Cecembia rubra]PSL04378.1 NadR type nicotinamide-nucleotide adenylyltransferase [Cecembia rubra]